MDENVSGVVADSTRGCMHVYATSILGIVFYVLIANSASIVRLVSAKTIRGWFSAIQQCDGRAQTLVTYLKSVSGCRCGPVPMRGLL